MRHLITLVENLRERDVGFRSLQEGAIDTTNASGELIFNIFLELHRRAASGHTFAIGAEGDAMNRAIVPT